MGEVNILGMPGPWAEDYREESDHYTTKIGGLPDWPVRDVDVGLDVLNCGLRGERLCLVAQVHALVSTPKLNIEEQVSYIFGCRMTKCGSNPRSWRAIRVQKCQDEKEIGGPKKEAMTLEEDSASISKRNDCHGKDLFSFGENDEDSDNDIDLEELGRVFSEPGMQASRSRKQNVSTHSKDARNALVSKPRPIDADINKPGITCLFYELIGCFCLQINLLRQIQFIWNSQELTASAKETISPFIDLNLVAVVPCFYIYSHKA